MSPNPNSGQNTNFGTDVIRHAALVLKALLDGRVWFLLKVAFVLPSLLYVVLPDLMSGNPADDIGVVLIVSYLFKQLIINLIPEVGEDYWPEEFTPPASRPNVVDVEPNQTEAEEPEKTQFTKAGKG